MGAAKRHGHGGLAIDGSIPGKRLQPSYMRVVRHSRQHLQSRLKLCLGGPQAQDLLIEKVQGQVRCQRVIFG
jgi:hypothetical protein